MRSNITAVINLYRRFDTVQLIIDALNQQTLPPAVIHVWCNEVDHLPEFESEIPLVISGSKFNHGVWARFAYAIGAVSTDYVAVFDDDTIPGCRWLENAMTCMAEEEGVYGTVGIQMKKGAIEYTQHHRVGWPNPNKNTVRVDFVGHSWVCPMKVVRSLFVNEALDFASYPFVGEDMTLSFVAQKYFKENTYVPPHPPDNKDLWGSINGYQLGTDAHSIWETNKDNSRHKMTEFMTHLKWEGWRWLCNERYPDSTTRKDS